MNILYLCDEYPPGRHGGIGTAVQSQAREMVVKGHKVIVAGFYDWGYGGENEFEDNGVKVFRFRRLLDSSWFNNKDSKRVRATYKIFNSLGIFHWDIGMSILKYRAFLERLIQEYNIEIVEKPDFNEYMQYCIMPVYFPKLNVPTVVKLHGTISYMLKERNIQPPEILFEMEKDVLNNADALSSVSNYTAKKTAQYFGLDRPIKLLYNGIHLPPSEYTDKVPLQVVFTGTLVEKKGIYQLAKAWNDVVKQCPGARLLILGKGHQEKVTAFLETEAMSSVVFKGHVSREVLKHDLSSSSVAIFPSYAETFGLAAAEAMAYGTATIFTNRTSGPEVIRDGIDGLIIDPDNVDQISEKIVLLLNDTALRQKLQENGRKRVLEEFEIGNMTDKNIAFYKEVLARDK